MKGGRRSTILLAVLLAAGAYVVWTVVRDPGSPGSTAGGSRQASLARGGAVGGIEELATAKLEQEPPAYRQGRDLFRFGGAPRARPTPPPPRPRQQPPAPRQAPAPPVAEPPGPQPPSVDVVYLGSFGRPGRRIAVFSDEENVYNAIVGDVIKEKFVLVTIGYESADLKFVGFPEVSPERLAVAGLR